MLLIISCVLFSVIKESAAVTLLHNCCALLKAHSGCLYCVTSLINSATEKLEELQSDSPPCFVSVRGNSCKPPRHVSISCAYETLPFKRRLPKHNEGVLR